MVLVATDRVLVLSSWGFVVGTGSSTVSGWEDPQTPMSSNRDRSDANACSVAGEAEEPAPSLAFVKGVDQHAFCGGPATQLSLPQDRVRARAVRLVQRVLEKQYYRVIACTGQQSGVARH